MTTHAEAQDRILRPSRERTDEDNATVSRVVDAVTSAEAALFVRLDALHEDHELVLVALEVVGGDDLVENYVAWRAPDDVASLAAGASS